MSESLEENQLTFITFKEKLSALNLEKRNDLDYCDDEEEETVDYKERYIYPYFGQETSMIGEKLISHVPSEKGGRIAISGFNYQMLVFIDFMIEAIEGKWTFLSLEHHDDIIVGNDHEKIVKFVQVKTSSKRTLSVTDSAVKLYSRSIGKKEGTTKHKLRNNSWIDKLINSAHYVKDLGLTMEYDLVTNFHIYNSQKIDISIYNSYERNKIISEDDHIYKQLSIDCYDDKGILIDYERKYNNSLKKILGNVYFDIRPDYATYKSDLCMRMSKKLGEGIRIDENDINWLIGELISRCSVSEDDSLLFLNIQDIEYYRSALQHKAVKVASHTVYKMETAQSLIQALKSILDPISDCYSKQGLVLEAEKFKNALLDQIDEFNTLQSLLVRFSKGTKPTIVDDEKDYTEDLKAFIQTSLLLFMIHEKYEISTKFSTLLIKEVETKSSEFLKLGFLNLGLELDMDEGIELLKSIISNSSEEEQLKMIFENSLYTIFHGESIDEIESNTIEIKTSLGPEIEELNFGLMGNDVSPSVTIIPSKSLKDSYTKLRRTENLDEFISIIEERWMLLKGGSV